MKISKIRVQNYKSLKDVCVPTNPDINVFVGENDAGKSTLLEVISIITSGKLNGYAFSRQIKDNMFNIDVRNAYIASLKDTKPSVPPQIIMEAYCEDGDAQYRGSNNSLSEDISGIRVVAEFDSQYASVYTDMLEAGEVKDIPVEFYRVDCKYFSGEPVSYRYCPIKSIFVDTTRKDYTGVVDRFVSENITQYLSPEDQVDLSIAYRKVRANFSDSGTITKLNEELKKGQALNGRVCSLELRENDVDEWKRQMAISIDTIPFEQIGFGTQNTIKVELAIAHDAEEVNMILMEEPENCLSHTNMTRLVHRVSSTEGKQIFISTHSSFVVNKLNLGNLLLVEKGEVKPFRDLPADTISYFKKLPGYDTLRLVLAEKVVLVEGPTDDLIIQRAYKDKKGCLPCENGIDIIAVDSLAFKRYCDIAVILKKKIAVVTDNDGNIALNIDEKYSEYKDSPYIRIFHERNEALNTIEPSVLAVNCDENGAPTEEFKTVISCGTSLMNRDYDGILGFMSKNKSEWAARVFDSETRILYPAYIEELIDEYC